MEVLPMQSTDRKIGGVLHRHLHRRLCNCLTRRTDRGLSWRRRAGIRSVQIRGFAHGTLPGRWPDLGVVLVAGAPRSSQRSRSGKATTATQAVWDLQLAHLQFPHVQRNFEQRSNTAAIR